MHPQSSHLHVLVELSYQWCFFSYAYWSMIYDLFLDHCFLLDYGAASFAACWIVINYWMTLRYQKLSTQPNACYLVVFNQVFDRNQLGLSNQNIVVYYCSVEAMVALAQELWVAV